MGWTNKLNMVPLKTRNKLKTRTNKALSMIVLLLKLELNYLIGWELDGPIKVLKLHGDHFERKSWKNCYDFWKRDFSLSYMKELKENITGDFWLLDCSYWSCHWNVARDAYNLLLDLNCFKMMVTVLAASREDVSSLAGESQKQGNEAKASVGKGSWQVKKHALAAGLAHNTRKWNPRKPVTCHICYKLGHIAENCLLLGEKMRHPSQSKL